MHNETIFYKENILQEFNHNRPTPMEQLKDILYLNKEVYTRKVRDRRIT